MKFLYRMVLLDIDGTLVNSHGFLSRYTIETIRLLQQKHGIKICLCTGRNVLHTKYLMKRLGLRLNVCVDGTIVFDAKQNKIIKQFVLEREIMLQIINTVTKFKLFTEFVTDKRYLKLINGMNEYNYVGSSFTFLKYIEYFFGVRYIKSLNAIKDETIYQTILAGPNVKHIKNEILKIDSNICVKDDLWENFLFIGHKQMGKANGLGFLCEHYDIAPEETISFGDQFNDIDMLKASGYSVAMGNAIDEVKAVANHITLTNNEDGVAKTLREIFL